MHMKSLMGLRPKDAKESRNELSKESSLSKIPRIALSLVRKSLGSKEDLGSKVTISIWLNIFIWLNISIWLN